MSAPSTSKEAVFAFAQAVADAVRRGAPPPGDHRGAERGAALIAGDALGLSRGQAQSRLRLAIAAGHTPLWEAAAAELSPSGIDAMAARRAQVDEAARLRAELKAALRERAGEDAILALIGRMADHDPSPPAWLAPPLVKKSGKTKKAAQEVPVALWSDWHFGEVVQPDEVNGVNAFNPAIARARIKRLVDGTVNLCRNHMGGNYPGIVIALLGDFISGGLHPELLRTDEEGKLESTLSIVDILVGALTRMADEFGQVFCPSVPGNHGRMTQKPEFKEYHKGNFDWLAYQLVARHFESRGDTRVKFMIPPSGDAFFRVYGLKMMATHGDMLGVKGGDGIIGAMGPIMRGEIKMRGQQSSLGRAYDLLLMGHWHQALRTPRAFVNNALKGFDEYAMKGLRAVPSPPSQTLFFVHPERGVTAEWQVALDPPKAAAPADWVSVMAG